MRVATRGTRLAAEALALLRPRRPDWRAAPGARVERANDQLSFASCYRRQSDRSAAHVRGSVSLVLGLKRGARAAALGALPTGQWRYLRADERFDPSAPARAPSAG